MTHQGLIFKVYNKPIITAVTRYDALYHVSCMFPDLWGILDTNVTRDLGIGTGCESGKPITLLYLLEICICKTVCPRIYACSYKMPKT